MRKSICNELTVVCWDKRSYEPNVCINLLRILTFLISLSELDVEANILLLVAFHVYCFSLCISLNESIDLTELLLLVDISANVTSNFVVDDLDSLKSVLFKTHEVWISTIGLN